MYTEVEYVLQCCACGLTLKHLLLLLSYNVYFTKSSIGKDTLYGNIYCASEYVYFCHALMMYIQSANVA